VVSTWFDSSILAIPKSASTSCESSSRVRYSKFSGLRSVQRSAASIREPWVRHTSMHNVLPMQVIDRVEHLAYRFSGILLREFSLFANPIEQFAAGGQLGNDIPFILCPSISNRHLYERPRRPTFDSNHSWNLTMCG
jgi:hypothetical protein